MSNLGQGSVGAVVAELIPLCNTLGSSGSAATASSSSRHSRPCNALSWNTFHTQQIAAAYDRARGEHSVAIWDLGTAPTVAPVSPTATNTVQQTSAIADTDAVSIGTSLYDMDIGDTPPAPVVIRKPKVELGLNEGASSVAWVPNQPLDIVVGSSSKLIKFYDLRGNCATIQKFFS